MTQQEESRPKYFKSSIWHIGLMVSGFCIFAGLMFTTWSSSPPTSKSEATAQSCHCHPNIVPTVPHIPNHGYPVRFVPQKGVVPIELPDQMPVQSGPVYEWPVEIHDAETDETSKVSPDHLFELGSGTQRGDLIKKSP